MTVTSILEGVRPGKRADKLRILVADDDPLLLAMAETALADDGVAVVAVADGAAAMEALREGAFDVMLLDLEMPRLDGFDVLARIRGDEALAGMPVIVLTGRRDLFAIEHAYQRGATSFITKPVVWPLLRHHVRFVMRAGHCEKVLGAALQAAG